METELTETQQAEFAILYGTLFALSLLSEYSHAIQPILASKNARNTYSKVLSLEKDCDAVKGTIKHEFMKSCNAEQRAIFEASVESYSDGVYAMFALSPDKQEQVREFIKEIMYK